MPPSRAVGVGVAVALIVLAAWIVVSTLAGQPSSSAPASAGPTLTGGLVSSGPIAATDPSSGLPTIARAALPPEARTTLALIAAGGPLPYDADGSVYQNRERILPIRPAGAYHEYTVETPGSSDRGARRIVTGGSGEAWWTADHYRSFARIVP